MLRQRVLTALVLLPLVLGLIWWAPTAWLYLVFATASLLVVWEWTALMSLEGRTARRGYAALTAVVLGLAWAGREFWPYFMLVSFLWWCLAFWLLLGYPENLRVRRPGTAALALLGLVLIVPTILGLAVLHGLEDGRLKLIYTMALVWVADTGAYACGRLFGRHKLAPNISPGKTWEGAMGALVLGTAWALTAGAYAFQVSGVNLGVLAALSIAVVAFSIVGDLTESMFKRLAGLKDSGSILPGHGGMLDRVDSLLAAVPLMALGLWATGL